MVDGEPIEVYEPIVWVPIFGTIVRGVLLWLIGSVILTIGIEQYAGYERIVSGLIAGVIVLIPILVSVGWEYIKWKVIEYRIYDDQIEERVGVYNKELLSLGYDEISETHKQQNVVESKLLGIADISLDTAASEAPAITMLYVRNADDAYEEINNRVDKAKT